MSAPKAAAQVRRQTLDLRSVNVDTKSESEKWSWTAESKTLTLDGIDFQIPFSGSTPGVQLAAGTTIILTKDSKNKINFGVGNNNFDKATSIAAVGNLTISGEGELAVDTVSAVLSSSSYSQIDSYAIYIFNGGNLSILDKAKVKFVPMMIASDKRDITMTATGIYFYFGGNLLVDGGAQLETHGQALGVNNEGTNPSGQTVKNYGVDKARKIQVGKGKITATTYDPLRSTGGAYGNVVKQALMLLLQT